MNPRILFVDDEANMRDLMTLYLRAQGMEVTAAATGQEAKELFGQTPFDLTILDLNLAGTDGLEVLDFIKRSDIRHPVIIYTGVNEGELVLKKFLLGRANAVVHKMSSLSSLLAEVRRHLPPSSSTGEARSEPAPSS
jgi:two-component system response regulator RstA